VRRKGGVKKGEVRMITRERESSLFFGEKRGHEKPKENHPNGLLRNLLLSPNQNARNKGLVP